MKRSRNRPIPNSEPARYKQSKKEEKSPSICTPEIARKGIRENKEFVIKACWSLAIQLYQTK